MADVPGDGRHLALAIGLFWLLFIIVMLAGFVLCCVFIGRDLLDIMAGWARNDRLSGGSAPPVQEAVRTLAKLAGLDF